MPLPLNVTKSNTHQNSTMDTQFEYPIPPGCHAIDPSLLDLRPDAEIDHDLLHPPPVTAEKNVWFYWHSGFESMHPYTQRNIRAWYRRFSKSGWAIRVMNRAPGSPLNIDRFLDVTDLNTFPKSFVEGEIGGTYGIQHTSDLVRWPLLLKYGGVYADVGLMQIGDLDLMWESTIANPASPFEVLSFNCGDVNKRVLANHFLVSKKNNPLWLRCHKLLLKLWAEDGGKSSTDGMHASPLIQGAPAMSAGQSFTENGRTYSDEEVNKMLIDYIIQGQVLTLVCGLIDEEDGWNGPEYFAKHVFGIDYMIGAQYINELTAWDGPRAFELMSLAMPKAGEKETADQMKAREIVEGCLAKSFSFKLAHGIIIRVLGQTLGSLWRANPGSDVVSGTYAAWLRYGMIYWCGDNLPERQMYEVIAPYKVGPLLREA